jgi:putative membrane protein
MENVQLKEKKSMAWINVLSVAIPLVVAILLNPKIPKIDLGEWTKILPHIIGAINTITSILLIYALYLIKNKQIEAHQRTMTYAFGLGAIFLVCYVLYHLTNPSTSYGEKDSWVYPIYLFILISHIVLSLVVLPMVLRAYFFAWIKEFQRHKKIVKFAYPIWLYVSITGVIAYLMIRPFYE